MYERYCTIHLLLIQLFLWRCCWSCCWDC